VEQEGLDTNLHGELGYHFDRAMGTLSHDEA